MVSKGKRRRHVQYGPSRPPRIRPARPVVTVVCDDTKTAVAYFSEIKREVKASVTVMVIPAPCSGATAEGVLARAIVLTRSNKPRGKWDSTWVLLDMEGKPQKQAEAQAAQNRGERLGVRVLLSKPCYEVWMLAHLADTGESFNDCGAVLRKIEIEWKKRFDKDFGPKKGQADYSKLMDLRETALRNAKRRRPDSDGSWTEVFEAVEAILSLFQAT